MCALLEAEDCCGVQFLHEKLDKLDGVIESNYDGHFGSQIMVTFEADEAGIAKGFWPAVNIIESHIRECEAFVRYVGKKREDASRKTLFHADKGFVLCNATATDGSDLGVSLHFLHDGEKATSWFIDTAADQLRKLADIGDSGSIRKIVEKRIDLEPESQHRLGM